MVPYAISKNADQSAFPFTLCMTFGQHQDCCLWNLRGQQRPNESADPHSLIRTFVVHLFWIVLIIIVCVLGRSKYLCSVTIVCCVFGRNLTHACRVDSSASNLWTYPFPTEGVVGWLLLLPRFKRMPVSNVNSMDLDQTSRSAASDLGLHCLITSFLCDARYKWVNFILYFSWTRPCNWHSRVSL